MHDCLCHYFQWDSYRTKFVCPAKGLAQAASHSGLIPLRPHPTRDYSALGRFFGWISELELAASDRKEIMRRTFSFSCFKAFLSSAISCSSGVMSLTTSRSPNGMTPQLCRASARPQVCWICSEISSTVADFRTMRSCRSAAVTQTLIRSVAMRPDEACRRLPCATAEPN